MTHKIISRLQDRISELEKQLKASRKECERLRMALEIIGDINPSVNYSIHTITGAFTGLDSTKYAIRVARQALKGEKK